jgi:hypothetical protein
MRVLSKKVKNIKYSQNILIFSLKFSKICQIPRQSQMDVKKICENGHTSLNFCSIELSINTF